MRASLLIAFLLCVPLCFAQSFSPLSPLAHMGTVVSLAQVLDQNKYSLFPGDPVVNISIWDTIAVEGYKLEHITSLGTHTGTHMSAPCHFIEGPQYLCVDALPASAFVMVAAMIDVSERVAADPNHANFHLEWSDIQEYERRTGQLIPRDAVVILYTGFGPTFGTPHYSTMPFPGFTEDCVQQMFNHRHIKATASDTWGPDASDDDLFVASNTTYANGGVTIENMNNLVALKGRRFGDLVIGAPTKLKNGSGYQTNVFGFLQ